MKRFLFLCLLACQTLLANTSQEERSKLKYQLNYQFGWDYKTETHLLAGFKFLDENNLIGARGGVGQVGDDSQTLLAIQYKRFVSNSFYISPELYYLNYHEDDADHSLLDSKDERLNALGVSLRVGSQWQWTNFTLGCDWIGLGRNVIHWERTEDFISTPYVISFFNAYVGWSF